MFAAREQLSDRNREIKNKYKYKIIIILWLKHRLQK